MPELRRVVIVGGGVGGLTSALALKNAGVDVEVHEKYDHLAGRATGFTLWSYAIKVLLRLGLDDPTRIGQLGGAHLRRPPPRHAEGPDGTAQRRDGQDGL